jgi:DNA-binding YbaB/EbfC family protein
MFTKLKQFKEMRNQAKDLQGKLAAEFASGEAAGGKVVITMDGNLTMTALAIDDELMSPDKKDRLEAAVKEAHGHAVKKIQRIMATKMKEMGGLPNIPGLS